VIGHNKDTKSVEHYSIGHLLGPTDNQISFTVNTEKLLHYHVGVFAFTGSGKSNLSSLVIRKAVNSIPNVKFVVFDICSEHGVKILDSLRSLLSRVVLTEPLPEHGNGGVGGGVGNGNEGNTPLTSSSGGTS
jgi:DNA helicase HerA-like ATPase